uniref:Uncharacterized protein n=1 Tax=Gloeothece verrucosa (strain PCC 7822) TaxID=497965 RepID=E0UH90_GLOV7|nr:hypothetical protein Cyan7822_4913 [Gloeothece verrucosa PCC 7822]
MNSEVGYRFYRLINQGDSPHFVFAVCLKLSGENPMKAVCWHGYQNRS